jgi:glycosyltransferase involved in cell wall biosynthesis
MTVAPRVAVLVDLPLIDGAGGHVKCWQRFAEAAVRAPGELDLTLFFLGDRPETRPLAPHVRYRLLPARLGTRELRLESGAGHTDLAGWHPRLARELVDIPVLQATSGFAFGRTAARIARRNPAQVYLNSLHTDVVRFTRIYTRQMLEGWLPEGRLRRFVLERLDAPGRAARQIGRKLDALLSEAAHVFASNADDLAYAASRVGDQRCSRLRRGIDRQRFDPARRDRQWLNQRFGIAADEVVVLFAGRVDATKRAAFVGELVATLRAEGLPVRLLVAGEGADRKLLCERLGPTGIVAPGGLDQDTLARVMASSDLFVFPSETETIGNVVVEARACGLPVLLSDIPTMAQHIHTRGEDGILVDGRQLHDWLPPLRALVADTARRQAVSAAAERRMQSDWPDWLSVLREDLLPVWRRHALAIEAAAAQSSGTAA